LQLFVSLLILNFLQAMIPLLWIGGLHRLSGPLAPGLRADLLGHVLILPPLLGIARFLGLPALPEGFRLIHLDGWVNAVMALDPGVRFSILLLFFGTAFIFLVQELVPVWQSRLPPYFELRRRDSELERIFEKLKTGFNTVGFRKDTGRPLKILLLETEESIAALQGVFEPVLLVSRGLISKLDEAELEAVIAHEYSHFIYGGNLRLFWIWVVRALQAFNPAALVAFRTLTEVRELSCDTLAAKITRKPATLSSAILKVYDASDLTAEQKQGMLNHAKNEILRRAEATSVRIRVNNLLAKQTGMIAPRSDSWVGFLVMGVMLWAIA